MRLIDVNATGTQINGRYAVKKQEYKGVLP